MQAKRTFYGGTWYRSMAEARTAESFDRLGIPFEYESIAVRGPGFECGRYTPDFHVMLPDAIVEVAGVWDGRHARQARALCEALGIEGPEAMAGTLFLSVDGRGFLHTVRPDGTRTPDARVNECAACGGRSLMTETGSFRCPVCGAHDGDRLVRLSPNLFDAAGVERYGR